MNNNNIGLVFLGMCILLGAVIISLGFKEVGQRGAAIKAGMSAQDYSHWIDDIK